MSDELNRLVEKAKNVYLYAFSLIATEATHYGSDDVKGLDHFREFPDNTEKRVVRLNMDTLYSLGFTQLANTPYEVHIPKIEDRYYLFPIMDAYTNVVESIGTRTPDKAEGDYVLLYRDTPVPAGYENHRVIRLENSLNSILLRIETRGKKDYEYVNKYQDQFVFKPIFPEKLENVPPMEVAPAELLRTISTKDYFELFAKLSKFNKIKDAKVLSDFKDLGYEEVKANFDYDKTSEKAKKALEIAHKECLEAIVNGEYVDKNDFVIYANWTQKFKDIGNYGTNYVARAVTAYQGWGANIPQDSSYASSFTGPDGKELSAKKTYKLTFEKDGFPHASYFWSLTLYGTPSQYPADNKINRYAINTYDVLDNIVELNEDGSLDIYISREEPKDEKAAKNWLPAPAVEDTFSLAIRVYYPDEFTLEGKWVPPVITEV